MDIKLVWVKLISGGTVTMAKRVMLFYFLDFLVYMAVQEVCVVFAWNDGSVS